MISGSVVDDVDYVLPIEPKTYMEIPNLTHEEAIGLLQQIHDMLMPKK